MIDPKLNDIPVNRSGVAAETIERESNDTQQTERSRRGRTGLSINDTIAGDSNLSVGSRGVDTSGVSSGSGAGAGASFLTPTNEGGSPAPNVVPGVRGTGTTLRADGGADQSPTLGLDQDAASSEQFAAGDNYEVAARAFQCWHERGCPEGSPEVDWHRAEQEIRERQNSRAAVAGRG